MAQDGLLASRGCAVVHQAIASSQSPQGNGSHFVHGVGGTVLHDTIARSDVMQQEIAIGVNDLAAQSSRDGERSAVDLRTGWRSGDGSDMASGATDLGEDLLSGLRVRSGQQSGVDRRAPG